MNILITNAVPLNGGDEALLRATIESLHARWPQSRITTLCNKLELTRQHLPDLSIASDLEFVTDPASLQPVAELYRASDLVLSAPGGIFHDHYPIEDRLRGLEFAVDLGKPVVLFAQSIGPFWKSESIGRVRKVFNRVSAICVRDALSRKHLLECGVEAHRIHETADAAFLWHRLAPELFQPKSASLRTIGLCFRVWPLGDTVQVKKTIAQARELCRYMLGSPERRLCFLSTCQGIPGYVDDSQLAVQIVETLPDDLKARCRIDRIRYAPRELMQALGECDAFIGMRLHGCILAMLAGTPAMGLGYEHKTEEIFRQLGFDEFQVRFDEAIETWLGCAERFLAAVPEIRRRLPEALDRLSKAAAANLDVIDEVQRRATAREPSLLMQPADALFRSTQHLDDLYERIEWHRRIPRALQEIAAVVPKKESIIILDENLLDRELFVDWRRVPFIEKDGEYRGPPPDDESAVRELERSRRAGAAFAAVAWPAFWWLEHYRGFAQYVHSSFACVLKTDRVMIFDLRERPVQNDTAVVAARDEVVLPPTPTVFELIDRVRSEGLTYLGYSALVELHAAVSQLEKERVQGVFIEAGCALGGSALVIASSKAKSRPLFLYDVFGMIPAPSESEEPEVHERYRVIKSGQASGVGSKRYYGYEENLLEQVTNNFARSGLAVGCNAISLVRGLYEETLQITGPVAFAHIDCDWYDSVSTCLRRIEPRLVEGGVLVIDDYFVWSGCRRAVDEYFANKMANYDFQIKSRLHIVRRSTRAHD